MLRVLGIIIIIVTGLVFFTSNASELQQSWPYIVGAIVTAVALIILGYFTDHVDEVDD